jgi:hypothetical protein
VLVIVPVSPVETSVPVMAGSVNVPEATSEACNFVVPEVEPEWLIPLETVGSVIADPVGIVTVPVNVGEASKAKPEMEAPEGIVTVPVKVGEAKGAFRAIDEVKVVDKEALLASEVAISPKVSSVPGALFTSAATSALTKAVVAT